MDLLSILALLAALGEALRRGGRGRKGGKVNENVFLMVRGERRGMSECLP